VEEHLAGFEQEFALGGGVGQRAGIQARINAAQYFGEVPLVAWDFTIGGYQPAQKHLKDRAFTPDEIRHYQKIIVAPVETTKLMEQTDAVAW